MEEMAFFKAIRDGSLTGMYLLHGEEEYSKEQGVRQCMALASDVAREMNVQQMKAPTADAVIAACETLPFFDRIRIITVQDMTAEEEAKLAAYASKMPDSALLLILRRGTAAKTGVLVKALEKSDRVVEFPRCDQGRAVSFALKRAKEANALLDRPTAVSLVDMASVDMASLENAVRKLAAYANGQPITREMIVRCITPSPEYNIFQILEAFLAGNLKGGLSMLQTELRDGGQSPLAVAAFLEGRCKLMLTARQLLDQHKSEQEIIRMLGGNAYAAKKTVIAAKKYRADRLRRAVIAFADVDAKLKQGILREDDSLLIAVYRAFSEAAAHE